MSRPETPRVLEAIEQMIRFVASVGGQGQPSVAKLRHLAARVEKEPWGRELRREIDATKDEVFLEVRGRIFDGRSAPGMTADESERELTSRAGALFDALHPMPAATPGIDISGCGGADQVEHKSVQCRGSPAGACAVVEGSIAIARRYVAALAANDWAAAYEMTDAGLRAAMSFEAFAEAHREAERRYRGPVLALSIERLAYVFTDDAARRDSATGKEGWPKGTKKATRRCRLLGFCRRGPESARGCRVALWIAEDEGGYRIANFDFYRD